MIFSYDEWPGGNNLAYSPAIWRAMFDGDPRRALRPQLRPVAPGLADDRRRARRCTSSATGSSTCTARTSRCGRDGLYEHGVMSTGIGWQVPRLCGLGQVDWGRFIGALYAVGYDGVVSIEHEDRRFEGDVELVKRGFLVARNTLRPLIA